MKYPLMLKPTWQGQFSRSWRVPVNPEVPINPKDSKTYKLRYVAFAQKSVMEVDAETLAALLPDLGKALCVAKFDEKGRPKPDWDKTERLQYGEPVETVFVDLPPVVVEDCETVDSPILLEESEIPAKYHQALKKNNLHDLDGIGLYLENHPDLLALEGIGKTANKEILEALEKHKAPSEG